jgi:phage gp45-like
MHRNTLSEISGRVMHLAARVTLNNANDDPMVQELFADMMNSDARSKIERIQAFGFTSMPLPRDEQQQSSQQQSGQQDASKGEQPKGPAAEGICLFIGGQRNHPVCIAIDDRRHRPMGLKPGENAQYDDIGQMTLLRRAFTAILSLDSKDEKGNMVERFVSLRHVEKQKQSRKGTSSGGSGGASAGTQAANGSSGGQSASDFKHEGETVNNEVRVTKKDVQILDGETVVARYDKGSGTWTFTSKNITLTASDHLTLQCTGGPTDIKGKPINFNGGGPSTPPFTVPG